MLSRIKAIFSPTRTQNVRKHLRKSLERGPIYDFKEILTTEGKVWGPNSTSDQAKKYQTVPSEFFINGTKAIDIFRLNRATILAVSYSSFSDPVIESFLNAIPSNVPKIVVRPILNPLKWLLWSKFMTKDRDHYISRGDIPSAIDVFGMENKYAGYIYLIDSDGVIQWKAAGPATNNEIEVLSERIKHLTLK